MELRYGFLIILALGVSSYAQLEDIEQKFKSNRNKKVFYCGENLSAALSTICHGNYNTIHKKQEIYQKKSYWDPQYNQQRLQTRDVGYPFKDKAEAASMISNFRRRRKRGVFNECCQKPCSNDELQSYCALPSKRRR